jgi:hypothetical protein
MSLALCFLGWVSLPLELPQVPLPPPPSSPFSMADALEALQALAVASGLPADIHLFQQAPFAVAVLMALAGSDFHVKPVFGLGWNALLSLLLSCPQIVHSFLSGKPIYSCVRAGVFVVNVGVRSVCAVRTPIPRPSVRPSAVSAPSQVQQIMSLLSAATTKTTKSPRFPMVQVVWQTALCVYVYMSACDHCDAGR